MTVRRPCILPLVVLVAGCGSTATISRVGGVTIDAEIVSSDARNVYVQGSDRVTAIPREEISDIDHPGNGAATAGALLSAYGIFNIIVGAPQCDTKGAAFCVGVFTPLAVGIPLTIYGAVIWNSSVSAAQPGARKSSAHLLPAVFRLAGQPASPGLTLGGTF